MNRLVRLYPKHWRERYEQEFLALLDARPPDLRDTIDALRGAADAHLHPGLTDWPIPWTHRIPGLLALAGAVAWTSAVAGVALGVTTSWDPWIGLPWGLMLMALSIPGDYLAPHGRRVALALGIVAIGVVVGRIAPEPIRSAAGFTASVFLFGGLLAAVSVRAGIPAAGRWTLVLVAIGLPLAPAIPAALELVDLGSGQPWHLLAGLPYGLVWALLAVRLTIGGSATIIDPPLEPEVAPT